MLRIIYVSEVNIDAGEMLREIRTIHAASVENNQECGVTGALLFSDLYFLQALEGETDAVSETLARILKDERHRRISLMSREETGERAFGPWSMKLAQRDIRSEPVFREFGLQSVFDPYRLTGPVALSLLTSLSQSRRADEKTGRDAAPGL